MRLKLSLGLIIAAVLLSFTIIMTSKNGEYTPPSIFSSSQESERVTKISGLDFQGSLDGMTLVLSNVLNDSLINQLGTEGNQGYVKALLTKYSQSPVPLKSILFLHKSEVGNYFNTKILRSLVPCVDGRIAWGPVYSVDSSYPLEFFNKDNVETYSDYLARQGGATDPSNIIVFDSSTRELLPYDNANVGNRDDVNIFQISQKGRSLDMYSMDGSLKFLEGEFNTAVKYLADGYTPNQLNYAFLSIHNMGSSFFNQGLTGLTLPLDSPDLQRAAKKSLKVLDQDVLQCRKSLEDSNVGLLDTSKKNYFYTAKYLVENSDYYILAKAADYDAWKAASGIHANSSLLEEEFDAIFKSKVLFKDTLEDKLNELYPGSYQKYVDAGVNFSDITSYASPGILKGDSGLFKMTDALTDLYTNTPDDISDDIPLLMFNNIITFRKYIMYDVVADATYVDMLHEGGNITVSMDNKAGFYTSSYESLVASTDIYGTRGGKSYLGKEGLTSYAQSINKVSDIESTFKTYLGAVGYPTVDISLAWEEAKSVVRYEYTDGVDTTYRDPNMNVLEDTRYTLMNRGSISDIRLAAICGDLLHDKSSRGTGYGMSTQLRWQILPGGTLGFPLKLGPDNIIKSAGIFGTVPSATLAGTDGMHMGFDISGPAVGPRKFNNVVAAFNGVIIPWTQLPLGMQNYIGTWDKYGTLILTDATSPGGDGTYLAYTHLQTAARVPLVHGAKYELAHEPPDYGKRITQGDIIGTTGGWGPRGSNTYDEHLDIKVATVKNGKVRFYSAEDLWGFKYAGTNN